MHWSISANLDSVKLLYYHGYFLYLFCNKISNFNNIISSTTPDKFKVYNLTTGVDVSNHPKFNNSNPTVFYFHGYLGNLTGTKNVLIVNSYLTRQDSNFIFVDWIELSNTNYLLDIIPNVWKVRI